MTRQDTHSASTENVAERHRPAAVRLLGARALSRLRVHPATLSWRAMRNPHFNMVAADAKDTNPGS